jgi:hypothetical protein
MTQDRRSGSVTAKRPPDRGGDAYAKMAAHVAERGPSSQIPAMTITRRLVWGRRCTPVALHTVSRLHRRKASRHSIPIAQLAGERFSATRYHA